MKDSEATSHNRTLGFLCFLVSGHYNCPACCWVCQGTASTHHFKLLILDSWVTNFQSKVHPLLNEGGKMYLAFISCYVDVGGRQTPWGWKKTFVKLQKDVILIPTQLVHDLSRDQPSALEPAQIYDSNQSVKFRLTQWKKKKKKNRQGCAQDQRFCQKQTRELKVNVGLKKNWSTIKIQALSFQGYWAHTVPNWLGQELQVSSLFGNKPITRLYLVCKEKIKWNFF